MSTGWEVEAGVVPTGAMVPGGADGWVVGPGSGRVLARFSGACSPDGAIQSAVADWLDDITESVRSLPSPIYREPERNGPSTQPVGATNPRRQPGPASIWCPTQHNGRQRRSEARDRPGRDTACLLLHQSPRCSVGQEAESGPLPPRGLLVLL